MIRRPYFETITQRLNKPRKFIQIIEGPRQVTKGRFFPRQRTAVDMPIIHCATIGCGQRQLMAK